jgi:hypothetical protein
MKIKKQYFPIIIVVTFVSFIVLGLILGFRPTHGGGGHNAVVPFSTLAQTAVFPFTS